MPNNLIDSFPSVSFKRNVYYMYNPLYKIYCSYKEPQRGVPEVFESFWEIRNWGDKIIPVLYLTVYLTIKKYFTKYLKLFSTLYCILLYFIYIFVLLCCMYSMVLKF
jgi:hypothetical protein